MTRELSFARHLSMFPALFKPRHELRWLNCALSQIRCAFVSGKSSLEGALGLGAFIET